MKKTFNTADKDTNFENITIKYSPGLVQITCDDFLKQYLEEKGNGALKLPPTFWKTGPDYYLIPHSKHGVGTFMLCVPTPCSGSES